MRYRHRLNDLGQDFAPRVKKIGIALVEHCTDLDLNELNGLHLPVWWYLNLLSPQALIDLYSCRRFDH